MAYSITECKVQKRKSQSKTWGLSYFNGQWYLTLTYLTPTYETFRIRKPTTIREKDPDRAIKLRDKIVNQLGLAK